MLCSYTSHTSPFTTLGAGGGSKTKTLTAGQLPAIGWKFAPIIPSSFQNYITATGGARASSGGNSGAVGSRNNSGGDAWYIQLGVGNNEPHDVMNPYILVNYEVIAG